MTPRLRSLPARRGCTCLFILLPPLTERLGVRAVVPLIGQPPPFVRRGMLGACAPKAPVPSLIRQHTV